MFKVICICDSFKGLSYGPGAPKLSIGDTYTVVSVIKPRDLGWMGPIAQLDFYILEETGCDNGYLSECFAPLNGPDEIEIADTRCREEAEALDIEFAEILENA